MPGVTAEQIEQAKQWDLLSYLQSHEPSELKKSGPSEYRTRSHDSLVISNGKWHWCSQNIGGKTALDYLVKVRGVPFVEAVEVLCDGKVLLDVAHFQPVPTKPQSVKAFQLPPIDLCVTAAFTYLERRGINREILAKCVLDHTVMETREHRNCMFVGNDITGKARYASLRGTNSDFKMDVPGSDKRFGFCIPSNDPKCRFLSVFESPIDALSYATLRKLNPQYGEDWNHNAFLSLGGTSPLALLQYLHDHPKIDHVFLCLDNDRAGMDGMQRIKIALHNDAELAARLVMVTIEPPPPECGKDYNEMLMAKRAKSRTAISTIRRSFGR